MYRHRSILSSKKDGIRPTHYSLLVIHYLVVLCLFLVAGVANAQPLVVGKLVSAKDKQPVMFANIAMMRSSDSTFLRGTVSDEKGAFTLDNDTIAVFIRISAIGYETTYLPITFTRYGGPTGVGKFDVGTVIMNEGAMTLDAVQITADRPLYSVDGEKRYYNVSDDASIQTGTASDALQNAPGVEVDAEGNVTLDGKSVTVWINDRPSHLDGEALKQYVKMLPANSIERIEVMKNPSAKYGGGGPVVNIVTSRKMLQNSFFSFGANGSTKPSVSPWISYVYSNEKFNISAYVSYSGSNSPSSSHGGGMMLDENNDTARTWTYESASQSRSHYIWASLNASYEFDSMNSISGWFGAYPSFYKSFDSSMMKRTDIERIGGIRLPSNYDNRSGSDSRSLSAGGYGGIDYVHRFDNEGHQLSVSFNGNFFSYNSRGTSFDTYFHQPQMSYSDSTRYSSFSGSGSLGLDYTFPYSKKGEIEAGVSFDLDGGNSTNLRDTLLLSGLYDRDWLRSDISHTPGYGFSGYLSWRRKVGEHFTFKLGGRLSYNHSTIAHQYAPQFDTAVGSLRFSPSLHLSYSTESMHNFSFSYRMSNADPTASNLCRFVSYGIESLSTGNPFLGPSYDHNADLSWDKYFTKFGSVGLSASYQADIDEINTISDARYVPFFGRVVQYSQPFNNADGRRFSFNANCMYRPNGFFNLRIYAGLTDDWYSVLVRPDQPRVEDRLLSFSIRGRLWAKLWNKLEVFTNFHYSTPAHSWSKLEIDHESKSISLGMSADFFDRRLSLYLNANDIFNWSDWASHSINPYNSSNNEFKWKSRYITFGATLRLGKMELEGCAKTGPTEGDGK